MFTFVLVIYVTLLDGGFNGSMREFGFRDHSSTWLLDRIPRVGVEAEACLAEGHAGR